LVSLRERDLAYILVILWALIGVANKQSGNTMVIVASIVTALLVAIMIIYSLIQYRQNLKAKGK